MDNCLSYKISPIIESLPVKVKYLLTHKPLTTPSPSIHRNFTVKLFGYRDCSRKSLTVVTSAGSNHCEFSSLNIPHEPKSSAGKFLSRVLQDQRVFFHEAAAKQLKQLADDRDDAVSRMVLSVGNSEAGLHRRIAELKEHECQTAIEDVMYMLIFYKFSELRVHLVPKLSRCIYNGILEIWPSKDWELESIHSFEVLEMVREHLTTVIGLRAESSVADNWMKTQIQRPHLSRVYAASILYGYFLKSALLRHRLELNLSLVHQDRPLGHSHRSSFPFPDFWSYKLKNFVLGNLHNSRSEPSAKKREKLRCYVMGFDPETLQRCAKLKSKEAVNLIAKHSWALFGDEKMDLIENDEVISTSFASLKRLVLEAVAFGSFLWDTEEYVNTLYKLEDNSTG